MFLIFKALRINLNPKMKSRFNKYLLSFCLMLACSITIAQKSPPTPPSQKQEQESGPAPNPGLPIDGGLSVLIVTGIAYGIYELKRRKIN